MSYDEFNTVFWKAYTPESDQKRHREVVVVPFLNTQLNKGIQIRTSNHCGVPVSFSNSYLSVRTLFLTSHLQAKLLLLLQKTLNLVKGKKHWQSLFTK